VSLIPADSTISRVIHDLREWRAAEDDWYRTRALIEEKYNYTLFPGACHIVPNHAVVIHALLHGDNDFQRTLMIANTDGWDTDCNSGNVGAIMGIRNGLAGIDGSSVDDAVDNAVDWRGPVADRMYLAAAEGGRVITDAVRESVRIANAGLRLHGQKAIAPKDGARFHFSLPGSVQGFRADDNATVEVGNDGGQLALTLRRDDAAVFTDTFIPEEAREVKHYGLMASPTLHSEQTVVAAMTTDIRNSGEVWVGLFARVYGEGDLLAEIQGPMASIAAGETAELAWTVPDVGGAPIAALGFALRGAAGSRVLVDRVDWRGAPTVTLGRPAFANTMWRKAWVDGVDQWDERWPEDFRVTQNEGTGLIAQGSEEWTDYRASVAVNVPLATEAGVAVRLGGLRRYYALLLGDDGTVRLVRECDGRVVLAEHEFGFDPARWYEVSLEGMGSRLRGSIDGDVVVEAEDGTLRGGGVGLVIREGTLSAGAVRIARPE
jgi:hypothetical protein